MSSASSASSVGSNGQTAIQIQIEKYLSENLPDVLKPLASDFTKTVEEKIQEISTQIFANVKKHSENYPRSFNYNQSLLIDQKLAEIVTYQLSDKFGFFCVISQCSFSRESENQVLGILPHSLGHFIKVYWTPKNSYLFPQQQLSSESNFNNSSEEKRDDSRVVELVQPPLLATPMNQEEAIGGPGGA